jgi:hypothetical protein
VISPGRNSSRPASFVLVTVGCCDVPLALGELGLELVAKTLARRTFTFASVWYS